MCNFSNPWYPELIIGVTQSYAMRMTEPLNMSFQVSVSNNSSLKIAIWLSTLLKRVRNIWKGKRDGDSVWKSRLREKGSLTVDLGTLSQGVEVISWMFWLKLIYTRLYSALREHPRMYPIQGHFQRPHWPLPHLGPGFRGPLPETFLRIRDY